MPEPICSTSVELERLRQHQRHGVAAAAGVMLPTYIVVTKLPITRTTICISCNDRIAIGPPVGRKHGTVSSRAIEQARAYSCCRAGQATETSPLPSSSAANRPVSGRSRCLLAVPHPGTPERHRCTPLDPGRAGCIDLGHVHPAGVSLSAAIGRPAPPPPIHRDIDIGPGREDGRSPGWRPRHKAGVRKRQARGHGRHGDNPAPGTSKIGSTPLTTPCELTAALARPAVSPVPVPTSWTLPAFEFSTAATRSRAMGRTRELPLVRRSRQRSRMKAIPSTGKAAS